MSEFNHVSQFLQTTFALSFGLIVGAEAAMIILGLPYHIKEIKEAQLEKEEKEQKEHEGQGEPAVEADIRPGPQIESQVKQNNPEDNLSDNQRRTMHFFNEVNLVFDQFMPVVMCCMVAGIHVGGTYVLGAICFFCYLFFNLVFNYAKLYDKLERKQDNRFLRIMLELMASIFIIIYFIGLFVRVQFGL